MARSASVGVYTPGRLTSPAALVALTTAGSRFGLTTSLAPVAATLATCSTVSTVPAPMRARSPTAATRFAIVLSTSGSACPRRGTSRIVIPASTSASPTSAALAGCSPVRIATTGICCSATVSARLPSSLTSTSTGVCISAITFFAGGIAIDRTRWDRALLACFAKRARQGERQNVGCKRLDNCLKATAAAASGRRDHLEITLPRNNFGRRSRCVLPAASATLRCQRT